jgi:hypothetical protein
MGSPAVMRPIVENLDAVPIRSTLVGGIKGILKRRIGVLPLFEIKLKIFRARETITLRWFEHMEVRRVRATLRGVPAARIVTVIPTYRRPDQLLLAIESALNQTVTDHAVVVVDDGAGLPPNLPEHERLVAMSLSRNCGNVGIVRNVGIRISDSAYLAFLDDDNTWRPDHLETCVGLLESGRDLVYSGLERVDAAGEPIDILATPFDRALMRNESLVDASTIVVRRKRGTAFSRVPRRFGDFPREDWEFVWRMSRRAHVALSPRVTARYVVHSSSFFTQWSDEAG